MNYRKIPGLQARITFRIQEFDCNRALVSNSENQDKEDEQLHEPLSISLYSLETR